MALRPGGAQDRFAVGAGTLSLLAAYAERAPVLVLIDDAHWLDAPSAEAIVFAIRRLLADAVAVLIAVRDGQASLLDLAGFPIHRVTGLDRHGTRELLSRAAGHAPTDDVARRLYEATAGNPLALLEVAPGRGRRRRLRDRRSRPGVTADHRGVPAPLRAAPEPHPPGADPGRRQPRR